MRGERRRGLKGREERANEPPAPCGYRKEEGWGGVLRGVEGGEWGGMVGGWEGRRVGGWEGSKGGWRVAKGGVMEGKEGTRTSFAMRAVLPWLTFVARSCAEAPTTGPHHRHQGGADDRSRKSQKCGVLCLRCN